MLPPKSHPVWKKLITREIRHEFKLISASMLMNRLIRAVEEDGSQETINKCIDEAYEFFQKFERIFQDDLKVIFV